MYQSGGFTRYAIARFIPGTVSAGQATTCRTRSKYEFRLVMNPAEGKLKPAACPSLTHGYTQCETWDLHCTLCVKPYYICTLYAFKIYTYLIVY